LTGWPIGHEAIPGRWGAKDSQFFMLAGRTKEHLVQPMIATEKKHRSMGVFDTFRLRE
jgi:hypothetical protein